VIPYVVSLLSDPASIVRSTACFTLTSLLSLVHSLSVREEKLFPEYILPALSRFPSDPEDFVRLAYATCIAQLAETARTFLDIAEYNRRIRNEEGKNNTAGNGITTGQNIYDEQLQQLQDVILKLVIDLLTLGNSKVKRALLSSITRLCIFIGKKRVNNELLPHLITVLNDRDWQLRAGNKQIKQYYEYCSI
jgi:phosphoinositide-3-kinase regulatory subunit 4